METKIESKESKRESKNESIPLESPEKVYEKNVPNRLSRKVYDSQVRFFKDNQELQKAFLNEYNEAWNNYRDVLGQLQKKTHESLSSAYQQYLEVYVESLKNPEKISEANKAYATYANLYFTGTSAPEFTSQYEEIGKKITEQLTTIEKKMKSNYNKCCEKYVKDICSAWNAMSTETLYPEDMWNLACSMMNAAMLAFNYMSEHQDVITQS